MPGPKKPTKGSKSKAKVPKKSAKRTKSGLWRKVADKSSAGFAWVGGKLRGLVRRKKRSKKPAAKPQKALPAGRSAKPITRS